MVSVRKLNPLVIIDMKNNCAKLVRTYANSLKEIERLQPLIQDVIDSMERQKQIYQEMRAVNTKLTELANNN